MCSRTFVLAIALATAACETVPTPTAPTGPQVSSFRPSVYVLELQAPRSPDFASGVAVIAVRTRDVSGNLVGADVTCTTTSGLLFPARFDSSYRPTIELVSTTVPARVSCSSGVASATVDVDMSAWGIDLGSQEYDPGPGPRAGETRVLLMPRQRIAGVEVLRLSIAWGDGTESISPLAPASTMAQLTHRYRTPGLRTATARVEWAGGAFERRFTLFGGPPGSQP